MLIIVAVMAFVGMRVYMLRAVEGKFRQSADTFGAGAQYASGEVTTKVGSGNSGSELDIEEKDESLDPCPPIKNRINKLQKRVDYLTSRIGLLQPSIDGIGKAGDSMGSFNMGKADGYVNMTVSQNQNLTEEGMQLQMDNTTERYWNTTVTEYKNNKEEIANQGLELLGQITNPTAPVNNEVNQTLLNASQAALTGLIFNRDQVDNMSKVNSENINKAKGRLDDQSRSWQEELKEKQDKISELKGKYTQCSF